ncbi:MAG: phosphatase PAP2-related protein [Verrucomicrobia bacterium]|nr:phosphatase PAP2-related protein [Verrucomicrobiota bacterium]
MNSLALAWGAVGWRGLVIALALVLWFWTQRQIGKQAGDGTGIGDGMHVRTARWHAWFAAHPRAADRALIASSLCIDGFGIFMIAAAVFGPSFAPFLGVLIVFSLRQICQVNCQLPPPPGIIWRDPGFPTLLVTYGVGNDFFFSGHTALAVLGAIEVWHLAPGWLAAVAILIALGEAVFVLVLRAHYTMDVVAGACAAWFAADMAAWLAPGLDAWLSG